MKKFLVFGLVLVLTLVLFPAAIFATPASGISANVSMHADPNYLYVSFTVNDTTDARLGQNIHGNDAIGVNINPTNGGSWGKPYDIIFQMGADPASWGGFNSGPKDGWQTCWTIDGLSGALPANLETTTTYDTVSGTRTTTIKIPLVALANFTEPNKLNVSMSFDVGDGKSYEWPDGMVWGTVSTYFVVDIVQPTVAAVAGTPVYTITASVSGNGSITPSGVFNISANAGQVYNITPNAGASITDVLVDGSSVGPVSSYTILNVNSNRTIQAVFSGGSGGIGVLGIDESMIGVLGISNADYSGFVTRCYMSILLREPDASGLSGWVNALSGGLTGEDVASGFVYSAELSPYLTALDNTGYLNFLYNRVLGRAADLPGLNGWLSDMSGGMTRAEILVYFLNSPEWQTICNAYGVTP